MIKNYLKVAFRNLWRTKGYSLLNIFGLALGITCAALIFLWVEDETSYNKSFPNKEDIYIVKSKQSYDGISYVFESLPGPFVPTIKEEVPGIKYAARVNWPSRILFSHDDKESIYQTGYYADPEFMDIFSLEFVAGEKAKALEDIHSIVVTESTAQRLFGQTSALGQTVKINNNESYTVSGVVKDLPTNSSYNFEWLISFKNYERGKDWIKDNWGSNSFMSFVQLEPHANLEEVNKKLYDFAKVKSGNENYVSRNFLYPMERWRLYNSFDQDGHEQEGRIKYVRLFIIIAWVVLLIACINFMNLATARSEKRAKEVGMRKVVGARRSSLIGQFLGEAILLATLSGLVAIGLTYLSIGLFNDLVEKELTVDLFKQNHILFLLAIVLTCGFIAGSYPAFYLSSFNALGTLKGLKQKAGLTTFVRRSLVVLQYTASIVLIICTVMIYQQIQHVKNRDMGYDREQILTTGLRGNMYQHIDVIKQQLKSADGVEEVGLSDMNMLNIGSNTWGINWQGKDPNNQSLIGMVSVDADFIPTMGLKLVDGRNFHDKMLGDSSSVVINDAFAKMIQADGRVAGQTLQWGETPYTIVGVVKDFVYNDMYAPAEPLFFYAFSDGGGLVNIRTKAGADMPSTLAHIEKVIKAHNPEYPFDYNFLDVQFNNRFKSEALIQKLAGTFAILSIVISCLGLFGLAAFTAQKRVKEIGIRKVLGASIASLVNLLNKEFVLLVVISCLIAFPIAYWIMNDWLGNYQYRTELHWWVFGMAGAGALLIALFTVSGQAIRTAIANPVDSLRDE